MTAFYDDSGGFGPGGGQIFACFGMVVVPIQYIHECSESWWEMIGGHFQYSGSLQTNRIEVKSSELHNMSWRLEKGTKLNDVQQNMFIHGLNSTTKVKNLIEAIWGFVAKPPVQMKYLAVIANKEEAWQEFRDTQFSQWRTLKQLGGGQKVNLKRLGSELERFLVTHTYEYMLQRLQYLSRDPDFTFSDGFVVGDQSSRTKTMLEAQAEIQAGLGKFSQLPAIVNRPWFGSSLYDPCLQIADWVAFSVRTWAEGKEYSNRIQQLLPSFRGYPDPDWLIGRGIVLCPNRECFPNLPLEG